jgi:hypothetical protein
LQNKESAQTSPIYHQECPAQQTNQKLKQNKPLLHSQPFLFILLFKL